ncbi:MAG: hypothetical protein ACREM1_18280 [Longimicrobiales bacterium]
MPRQQTRSPSSPWNHGAKLAVPGIVLGSILAIIIARPFLGRWYQYLGRTTLDLAVLGIGAGIAFAVVLIASGRPARRAASVQPSTPDEHLTQLGSGI